MKSRLLIHLALLAILSSLSLAAQAQPSLANGDQGNQSPGDSDGPSSKTYKGTCSTIRHRGAKPGPGPINLSMDFLCSYPDFDSALGNLVELELQHTWSVLTEWKKATSAPSTVDIGAEQKINGGVTYTDVTQVIPLLAIDEQSSKPKDRLSDQPLLVNYFIRNSVVTDDTQVLEKFQPPFGGVSGFIKGRLNVVPEDHAEFAIFDIKFGSQITYTYKSKSVPEPGMILGFALGAAGLVSLKQKQKGG
jgi:hypothetical protein